MRSGISSVQVKISKHISEDGIKYLGNDDVFYVIDVLRVTVSCSVFYSVCLCFFVCIFLG